MSFRLDSIHNFALALLCCLDAFFPFRYFLGADDIIQAAQYADKPQFGGDTQEYSLTRQSILLLTLTYVLRQSLQLCLVWCAQASTNMPSNISCEFCRPKSLMKRADDFDSS